MLVQFGEQLGIIVCSSTSALKSPTKREKGGGCDFELKVCFFVMKNHPPDISHSGSLLGFFSS